MKYAKMLGLAAVAAMALMAWVGAASASADVLCTENNTPACAKPITSLVATQVGSAALKDTSGNVLDTCTGAETKGTVEKQGEGVEPEGPITSLTWSGCTQTTKTLAPGRLKVETRETSPGVFVHTVTATGTEVTISVFGGLLDCVYGPGATPLSLGDLTLGKPAILHINTVIPLIKGSGCPATGRWEATFQITNHSEVWISKK